MLCNNLFGGINLILKILFIIEKMLFIIEKILFIIEKMLFIFENVENECNTVIKSGDLY